MKIFDGTRIPILSKALDAYTARQRVSAENIANIDTPGYKGKRIAFEEQLSSAFNASAVNSKDTHSRHIPINTSTFSSASPQVVEQQGEEFASGTNDVDIDIEMATMVQNQIRFKFASRLLGDTFKGLQKSIRGHA